MTFQPTLAQRKLWSKVIFSLAVQTLMSYQEPKTLPQKGALRVYRLASAPLLRRARTLTRRGSGHRVQR